MELHERLTTSRSMAPATSGADPFAALKNSVHLRVIGDLGPQLFNVATDPSVLRERVLADIRRHLTQDIYRNNKIRKILFDVGRKLLY